ncbi:MAG TPA: YdiU family protein [Vicinamibacterales bacterium]|nr:YdiU family protein [Vicinamibacterales bacterium]
MSGWRLEHTYAELPRLFFTEVAPTPVREPRLVVFNRALAAALGLDAEALDSQAGASIFAGNTLPDGAKPLAQAYAGHQFGYFTGLGDGRAILLGEQVTPDGSRVDIQLKGAGPTRYSRRGDGRAALGPMLREHIISEAMHGLGIPTTRSLAVVSTGEPVYREQVLEGAVLTRIARSHIRVGTMEWAAAHKDEAAMRALAEYTGQRHYPHLAGADNPDTALLDAVVARQANLIAQWQSVGFIHGVMNTDNMSLAGETIDYGPCAFMDSYDPATVFSSIDSAGRYAYGNQPAIAQWNLARLAEAMLPLLDPETERAVERANGSLARFAELFDRDWLAAMRGKLGLFTEEADDRVFVNDLLAWMTLRRADFTNTFRALTRGERPDACASPDPEFDGWHERWQARRERQPQTCDESRALMRRHNPVVIPRNHKVEEALAAAAAAHDYSVMRRLLDALACPYDYEHEADAFTEPMPTGLPYRTFCGT